MDNKPLRLRIPPTSPRETHSFAAGGVRFQRSKGWYPITTEEKARFEKARLHDTNPSSGPLFQIVTAERALEIDIEEGRAGASEERTRAAKDAAMRAEVDAAKTQLAALQSVVFALVPPDKRTPEVLAALGREPAKEATPAKPPADEPKKAEEKAVPQKPARPGEQVKAPKPRRGSEADAEAPPPAQSHEPATPSPPDEPTNPA